jgi:hypothetical protein
MGAVSNQNAQKESGFLAEFHTEIKRKFSTDSLFSRMREK